jgi:hypothetical protein
MPSPAGAPLRRIRLAAKAALQPPLRAARDSAAIRHDAIPGNFACEVLRPASRREIDGSQFLPELFWLVSNALCRRSFVHVAPSSAAGGACPNTGDDIMRQQLRVGAVALALLGSVGLAAAQHSAGGAQSQDKLTLSPAQKEMIKQGLSGEQAQPQSSEQANVGSKAPAAAKAQPMPNKVTADVPATKNYLFVKFPDRILLIDPDSKLVAEIIPSSAPSPGSASSAPKSQ